MQFLYSHSPVQGFVEHSPNGKGIAEDPIHLPIRIDYTTGRHRSKLSKSIVALHMKFSQPAREGHPIYHLGDDVPLLAWDDVPVADAILGPDWDAYLQKPFHDSMEYVSMLRLFAQDHADILHRKDAKGNTVLHILKNAGKHYHYLQNGSVFRRLAPGIRTNTMGNEAIHRQIKRWAECIYQCHKERLVLAGRVFGVYKALCHRANPTTILLPESTRLSIVAGCLTRGATPKFANVVAGPLLLDNRDDVRRPIIPLCHEATKSRKEMRASKKHRYTTHMALRAKASKNYMRKRPSAKRVALRAKVSKISLSKRPSAKHQIGARTAKRAIVQQRMA